MALATHMLMSHALQQVSEWPGSTQAKLQGEGCTEWQGHGKWRRLAEAEEGWGSAWF